MIIIKLNDKIKIQLTDGRSNKGSRIGTVIQITKHTFTLKYQSGVTESFTLADIINPQDFVLMIREGKGWVKLGIEQIKVQRETRRWDI